VFLVTVFCQNAHPNNSFFMSHARGIAILEGTSLDSG